MIETLVPLTLPPGYMRNGTKYDAKGRWYDGNLVRWREGVLQPIGGWAQALNSAGFTLADVGVTTNAAMARWNSTNGERIVVAMDSHAYANDSAGGGTGAWTDISAASWPSGAELAPFGGHLIAHAGLVLYTWDGTMASDFTAIAGAPAASHVVVTPERFLVALGSGTPINPRLVSWADQETETVWTPTPGNQAGNLELETDGQILLGRALKGQTMILTTSDCWSMSYIGGDAVFSFRKEGDKCGAISPGCAVPVGDRMYWMGRNGFFVYDGYVRPLPCEVWDKVYGEMSLTQKQGLASSIIINSMSNAAFNEVWWFYSTTGNVPNRQVVYNYLTNHWEFHSLDRIAGLDAGFGRLPYMINSAAGRLFEHENPVGTRAGGPSYAESGPIELGDGNQTMRVQRILPDGTNLTDTTLTVFSAFNPVESETTNGPFSLANPIDCRFTGRQVRLKVSGTSANDSAAGGTWRFGVQRFGLISSSRR